MPSGAIKPKYKFDSIVHGSTWGIPPQMISQEEKEKPEWQQGCMDYFDHVSGQDDGQRIKDERKLDYISGETDMTKLKMNAFNLLGLSAKDTNGAEKAIDPTDIEDYIHYPIMVRPFNTIVGEYIKRIAQLHGFYVKNESPNARNEHNRIKHEMLANLVEQEIMKRVTSKVASMGYKQGSDEFNQAIQQNTPEDIQDFIDRDYIDIPETVMQITLRNLWRTENLDSEFIEGFKYLCTVGKEFYHIYCVNNKTKIKNLYPGEVFHSKSPNTPWVADGQYAGFRSWYTPSAIIDMFYDDLTSEDFRDIEASVNPNVKKADHNNKTGIASISYDTETYADPLGNLHGYLDDTYDMISQYQHYGNSTYYSRQAGLIKVVRAYWQSYRMVGWLTSYDEKDREIIEMVDDNYKPDKVKGESVRWFPQKQLYTGAKILNHIYKNVVPYTDQIVDPDNMEYNPLPIDGCYLSDNRRSSYSLFDLMLPWNELFDIVAAELKETINSSIGRVLFMSIDHLPNIPGFDMNKFYYWVRKFKIAWVKQPKGPNTFNQFQSADMAVAQQIVAQMNALDRIMQYCDSFAGFVPGRIAGQSTETTLGQSNQNVAASVNQTEYLFFKHSKLIQRVLNQALNISKKHIKDNTYIRNLFDDYQQAFIDYDPEEVTNSKLGLFTTNSSEDLRKREQMESLMQPAMQNGADFQDMSEMVMAETISEIRTLGHKLRRNMRKQSEQQMQAEQRRDKMEQDNFNRKQDDLLTINREKNASAEEQAYIKTYGGRNASPGDDINNDGIPDVLEYENFNLKQTDLMRKHRLAERKQNFEEKAHKDDINIQEKKLKQEKARTAAMKSKSKAG